MLLDGVNHVAILTDDTDRLARFYEDVFEATIGTTQQVGPGKLTFIDIGPHTELNVFELEDTGDLKRGSMFGHGPVDHIGLQAANRDAFVEIRRRLMARGASDGFVTDFGSAHSVFFRDPDGLECEVLLNVPNPSGESHPPGTPARGYDG